MSAQNLSRPLAARIASLPQVVDTEENPTLAPAVIEAAAKALAEGRTHYTDRPGILGLRNDIVEGLGKRFGLEISPEAVTITCGATEARFVAAKQLTTPGQSILCAGSASHIAPAATLVDAYTTTEDDGAVAFVYLTPADKRADIDALLKDAANNGRVVVWDLSVGDSAANTFHPAQNAAVAANVLTIGSLSEAMPGWRVGWMAGSKVHNKLRAYKQSMTICTTSVSQWAALGLKGGA